MLIPSNAVVREIEKQRFYQLSERGPKKLEIIDCFKVQNGVLGEKTLKQPQRR